ncbi:hypothetical protein ACFYOK_08695 [Microbispora bryophytorum]|uniref:hypothetical protein n=1 Tax=Microbispora bryophytorum TaxID=1460882 RepID=UPI0033CF9DE8
MIDSLLDRATSILERRFLRNAFLPVLLFAPVTLLPSSMQGGRLDRGLAAWDGQSLTFKVTTVVGYFTLCWFGAAIVASQWRNIVRLFEGYPLERLPRLREFGVRWHQAQREELTAFIASGSALERAFDLRYWHYPDAEDAVPLPTRLGNVLLAAELYPLKRYGTGLVPLWSRLHAVLPSEVQQDIEDARATMEFLLVLCLWLAGFAALNPLIAIWFGTSMPIAIAVFALGLLCAYWAYLSAIPAAQEYGEQLRAAFETHRFELLRRMRLPLPENLRREQAQWRLLDRFVAKGADPNWTYDTDESRQIHPRLLSGPSDGETEATP